MTGYQYWCHDCHRRFQLTKKASEPSEPPPQCPRCNSSNTTRHQQSYVQQGERWDWTCNICRKKNSHKTRANVECVECHTTHALLPLELVTYQKSSTFMCREALNHYRTPEQLEEQRNERVAQNLKRQSTYRKCHEKRCPRCDELVNSAVSVCPNCSSILKKSPD